MVLRLGGHHHVRKGGVCEADVRCRPGCLYGAKGRGHFHGEFTAIVVEEDLGARADQALTVVLGGQP